MEYLGIWFSTLEWQYLPSPPGLPFIYWLMSGIFIPNYPSQIIHPSPVLDHINPNHPSKNINPSPFKTIHSIPSQQSFHLHTYPSIQIHPSLSQSIKPSFHLHRPSQTIHPTPSQTIHPYLSQIICPYPFQIIHPYHTQTINPKPSVHTGSVSVALYI